MRRFLIAAAVLSSMLAFSRVSKAADDDSKTQTVKGVLIDRACGAKQMKKDDPETAAADHDKACALKCGKKGGYAVISGKHMLKIDEKGNKMVEEYLDKHDSTKVSVKGTEKGDMLTVESIEPAESK